MALSSARDKKMEKRKEKRNSKEYKIDRLRKKRNRNKDERKKLVREGTTYESQMELNVQNDQEQTSEIPSPLRLDGTESTVFIDLETTGFGKKADIIQIAAKTNTNCFNKYVIPTVEIDLDASKVTGITFNFGTNKMYARRVEVEPVQLHKALLDLIDFIKEHNQPILIGHNLL